MRRARRSAVLAAAFMVASATPALALSGGTVSNDYPFTVWLSMDGRGCSGTLIDPRWVATAADCFPENSLGGVPAKPISASLTVSAGSGQPAGPAQVTNLVRRPDRNLMLAELNGSATLVQPVKPATTAPAVGEVLRVAGLGRSATEWGAPVWQSPVMGPPARSHTFSVTATNPNEISLRGDNGVDACKGDGGGPQLREANGTRELVAVSSRSWQHGCVDVTETRQGTTGTRVDDLGPWLRPMLGCLADGPSESMPIPPAGGVPRWYGWDSPDIPVSGAPAVTSWGSGRIDLFTKGADNVLYHRTYQDNAWSATESLGDGMASEPSVVSWAPGRFDVFARGYDNSLQHKWFDGSWHPWESLGGGIQYAPTVASWGPGRLDVFAVGDRDNALYHKAFDGTWRDWEYHGGKLNASPAAASWGPNRIDVFGRGTDNALYHMGWDNRWFDWEHHGGYLTSAPTVTSWGPNRLDVFAADRDSRLLHYGWAGQWFRFQDHAGRLTSAPAAVSWGPNRVDVFAAGTSNALCHTVFG
ncbi:trypsin-like serine protease [Amycolatopsis sp.]|uniref:trypsin-like serine protease n=1 Tax=Amycolatopsis sp. TaxID=37632 RepID=UPI002D8047FD|nr:trypsin-like serine protease [Amycolatopsis sp.]HET6708360.1 trypsin-like serine protease [Amycolatopsis sp.]